MARSVMPLWLIVCLTALAYLPVTTADFVYEDRDPLVALDQTRPIDQRGPWAGWATEAVGFAPAPRLLPNLTMRLQGWAHATAQGYHAANVAVHLLNGVLLYAVVTAVAPDAALLATLLFLLHPIQTEAVSYVAARPDLMLTTALLVALVTIEYAPPGHRTLVTICGVLALLAKESGVIILGLVPLWLWARGQWSRRWLAPLGVWTVGGLAVAYRLIHVSAKAGAAHPWGAIWAYTTASDYGWLGSAARQLAALGRLVALVVWPVGFSIEHRFDAMPLAGAVLAVVALVGLLVTAWRLRTAAPWLWVAVLWALVTMTPRLLVPLAEPIHEHHLYPLLIGAWIALAVGLTRALTWGGLASQEAPISWLTTSRPLTCLNRRKRSPTP